MPRIPIGDFGNTVAQIQPQIQRANAAPIGEAIAGIGNSITEQRQAMSRAKAANALQAYSLNLQSKTQDISERIARGEINYEDAQKTFADESTELDPGLIKGMDPITAENYANGINDLKKRSQIALNGVVDNARKVDFQGQFETNLDLLGKEAGMPGADVEKVNAKADQFAPLAIQAGIPKDKVDKALQNFKDKNWENQAVQRAMESSQDMNALDKLQHDLTAEDGFYAGKLDTDRRNAVLNAVLSHKITLQNALEHAAAKHEARGEVTLAKIDQQISTGVPATPQMWAVWAKDVKGTPAEAEFNQRLQDERDVQNVLRMPVDQQLKYIDQKQAELTSGGGNVHQIANLNRLQNAVKGNIQLLQNAPLEFSEHRTGMDVKPLAIEDLMNPGGPARLQDQISERVVTLQAMRKQYGEAVPLKPLLASEAQTLTQVLSKATPQQAASLYGTLHDVMGSPDVYKAAMQQIAPDAPVTALAGMIAAKPAEVTTEHHWFSADDKIPANVVASTILQGQRLLDPTKQSKGEDGKPSKGLYLPESKTLQAEFTDQVGAAFAGRPNAAESAFQAVQAYYVGKAAQTGRLASNNQDIDSKIVKEAISATLGAPVDYNGNGVVLAPWGMERGAFQNKVQDSFAREIKTRGMDERLLQLLPSLGLRNNGDGTYYVTQGRSFLTDKKGQPFVINVLQ